MSESIKFDPVLGRARESDVQDIPAGGGGTTAASSSAAPIEIKDEGVSLTSSVGSIDFTGDDVTATTVGNDVTVDIAFDPPRGTATLVGGTATVLTTFVDADAKIFLTGQNDSGDEGELTITNRVNNVSFDILSASGTDTRDVAWFILDPSAGAPAGGDVIPLWFFLLPNG